MEEIYLCQVGPCVSCGACCGLYNVPDPSPKALARMLEERTAAFEKVPREMEAVLDFGRRQADRVPQFERPMPEFHHCPYLGLIGRNRARVGCLLHPAAEDNNGIDWRGLSHYGSMTCSMYFCPTHHRIPGVLKEILRTVIDDWYLFGLVVQETVLLEVFYAEITARVQHGSIAPAAVHSEEARNKWRQLFDLKLSWPFTDPRRPMANYFFNDGLYPKPRVVYPPTRKDRSRYDMVFRELHSVFASEAEVSAAEKLLDGLFASLAEAIQKACPRS